MSPKGDNNMKRKIRQKLAKSLSVALILAMLGSFVPTYTVYADEDDKDEELYEIEGEEDMDILLEDEESEVSGSDDDSDENSNEEESEGEEGAAILQLGEAQEELNEITEDQAILATVYLCDNYVVKSDADSSSNDVISISSGQSVQIVGVKLDNEGKLWYKVFFYVDTVAYKGYIEEAYLITSDENLVEWEGAYIEEDNVGATVESFTEEVGYPDIDQFPASYRNALLALKKAHPQWTFVMMDTGLDWNTAISKELGDKSLVPSSSSGSWQNGSYGSGWSYASESILRYYMDPRNFLNESYIFQFEQLTYNSSYHTTDAIASMLKNSFMASTIPGDSMTYAQAFAQIGANHGVSPFHLASRVLQEQGTAGTSPLISGTYPGYEGYYNYFNVGASGSTNTAIFTSGLAKAKENGWNTRYKSLVGGAGTIGNNYILKGQDTLYLEKFNVSGGKYANYTHQYMQNIMAPASESTSVKKAYASAGALNNSFVFKIPVYKNMPTSACAKPQTTDSLTINTTDLSGLEVGKTKQLVAYINGSQIDSPSELTFTSSNTAVATVSASGVIKAIGAGSTQINVSKSGANTATCNVSVIKANMTVSTPTVSSRSYVEGAVLENIVLPAGWEWCDPDMSLYVGSYKCDAVYTPENSAGYNSVTREIDIRITKAIPTYGIPNPITVTEGTVLNQIVLPQFYSWESFDETVLDEAGTFTYYLSYNPDKDNYYTIDHIPVKITVESASTEEPGGEITTSGESSSTNPGEEIVSTSTTSTSAPSTSTPSTSTASTSKASTSTVSTSTPSTSTPSTSTASTSKASTSTVSTSTPSTSTAATSSASTSTVSTSTASTSSTSTSKASTSTSTTSAASTSNDNSGYTDISVTESSPTVIEQPVTVVSAQEAQNDNTSPATDGMAQSEAIVTVNEEKKDSITAETLPEQTTPDETETVSEEKEEVVVPSVTIDMDDLTYLTVDRIQMAKEQQVTLILDMGNGVSWSINPETIATEGNVEVDMAVVLNSNDIPADKIDSLAAGKKTLEFTLAHDGEFGFVPVLTLPISEEDAGRYANLFYYNPATNELEFVCATIINKYGNASFKMDHASSYVIIVDDVSMETTLAAGSASPLMAAGLTRKVLAVVAVLMLLVVIGYLIYYFVKRKEDEEEDNPKEDTSDEKYWKEVKKKADKSIEKKNRDNAVKQTKNEVCDNEDKQAENKAHDDADDWVDEIEVKKEKVHDDADDWVDDIEEKEEKVHDDADDWID